MQVREVIVLVSPPEVNGELAYQRVLRRANIRDTGIAAVRLP